MTHELDSYLKSLRDTDTLSGSVLIARDGEILLTKGYGFCNYELNMPNKESTIFRIASLTKSFTAVAILQLVEREFLKLTDTISRYIPDFPNGNMITIHHLLSHTSGIVNYTKLPDYNAFKIKPSTPEMIITRLQEKPLNFVSGTEWEYSNSGYTLLTHILEKVSGTTYEQFLKECIFDPLEMHNSGYDTHATVLANRASGYIKNTNGSLQNAPYRDMSLLAGAGGLYSTVEDLYKFHNALYTTRLLSKESICTMQTPIKNNYCYGWFHGTLIKEPTIYGMGAIDGFHSILLRFLNWDACIILLCNSTPIDLKKIAHEIVPILAQ